MSIPMGLKVVIPIRTTNQSNVGMPNSQLAAILIRTKKTKEHKLARMVVSAAIAARRLKGSDFLPARVTMTRLSAGELDDDGLRNAIKYIRDGVAEALGTGDSRKHPVKWEYAQRKAPAKTYAVEILIERSDA